MALPQLGAISDAIPLRPFGTLCSAVVHCMQGKKKKNIEDTTEMGLLIDVDVQICTNVSLLGKSQTKSMEKDMKGEKLQDSGFVPGY